jgi:hypothetical protein
VDLAAMVDVVLEQVGERVDGGRLADASRGTGVMRLA